MWYVIQTLGGEERTTVDVIQKWVSSYYFNECFVPVRERLKKFHGCWTKVEEVLFCGYIFVISETPREMYDELRRIPKLTKMLGRDGDFFSPLNEKEENIICMIGDRNHRTSLSKVVVQEGKKIYVLDGPLKNYEENVVKVNLHKREVMIQLEFMEKIVDLKMGIEVKGLDDVCNEGVRN